MNLHNQILLSRLLTRSGDQAWDFALPVTLVMLFPKNFSLVATIYFLTKVGQFLFQPTLAGVVDRWKRSHTAYLGTVLQLLSVLGAALCLYGLAQTVSSNTHATLTTIEWALIVGVTTASIVSSLGSGLMDIAVGNDWIPTLVSAEDLARVNSRLKQIDLFTEVLSPVLAGILLAMNTLASPLFGFSLVVLWNVVSFVPEVFLLRRVFTRSQSLQALQHSSAEKVAGLLRRTTEGWHDFWKHPASPVMIAYALLWLSALSPHGVLLTSFLKGGWQLSEFTLGLFRGFGALFGLVATLVFPPVVRQFGVFKGSLFFICLQAATLLLALPFFLSHALDGLVFLALILVSRIGLYGFSMGEMEIRQRTIAAGLRGRINGVASALTSFATLLLFGAGTLVEGHEQFAWMVGLSVFSVCAAAVVYFRWYRSPGRGTV